MTSTAPPVLPGQFRVAAASDAELAKFGFPPRPTSTTSPRLARLWNETFGRDVAWTTAQLAPVAHFASRPRRKAVVNGDNSANWSGVVVNAQPGQPISLAIAATWNVPQLTGLGSGTQAVGIWIGLDGYNADSPGLLQAGIGGSTQAVGVPSFYAWCEWLSPSNPAPAQRISNFPVQAGDVIQLQIWVTSPTTATIVLSQVSATSQSAPVIATITAPSGVRVMGASAEWIVERPLVDDDEQSTLADYAPVTFTDAVAWSQAGTPATSLKSFAAGVGQAVPFSTASLAASLDFVRPVSLRLLMGEAGVVAAGSGSTIAMEQNGTEVSWASILGRESLRCQYFGLQPGKLNLN